MENGMLSATWTERLQFPPPSEKYMRNNKIKPLLNPTWKKRWLWNWEFTSHLGQYIWKLYWPESKFTKSDINWKKVMKSIMNDITCLFSWIKKIRVSLFGAPPVRSPYPHYSTSLHSASYTGTCKICLTQHTTRMS